MAGQNTGEIRVAGVGHVYVAPVGTAPPADFTTGWTGWSDLGFTTQDGVKVVKKDKMEPVETWQAVAPVRLVHAQRDLSLKFTLLQVNTDTVPFFFGGGTVDPKLGYTVSGLAHTDERALGIEFNDGPQIVQRIVVPRGAVTETDDTSITRTAPIKLGVTFVALLGANNGLATWTMNTLTATAGS
ncbi:phage tail tube protein [Kutzneria sp. CA-103260]|uniref:phage tail tube protein n=1 Tax=Kutzneria sp. CA-103260 TaxID=2802641 RepID=UPI001BA64A78|nr:phage tail protein [Kutzneria sp. CA-103260]QUQ62692.1 hypothetical protein JJ691_04040 [Kutzneria sp. CA-103260]